MIVNQTYESCLSQASYLIADESTRMAVVVDPLRDIDQYLDAAREHDLTIVGVILTHFHADFVAGHLELADATGAWIGLGDRARPEYDARLLADGERISLGDVTLEVLATPGHTPESISVLVYEHRDDEVAYGVLTGDSLFVGDVGRVDLQASFGADPLELAHEQFDTIQAKLMALPDAVRVFPAHGAGSACGKNISEDRDSTIGRERATNIACQPMGVDEFVAMITNGQPPVPEYFVEDAALNRQVHDLFREHRLPPLGADAAFEARGHEGVVILDTRDVETFVLGHIPGSLNVPLAGRFAETAGMFLDFHGASVILVSDAGTELQAERRLARVGFDRVTGYVPAETLRQLADSGRLETNERINAEDVEQQRADDDTVFVDVRGPGEYEDGAIAGSINIPLPELAARVDELSRDTRLVINCAGGWRSGVATSYLKANGFTASDVRGGYDGYAKVAARA
ncbi:MAG TPA: MBL fold metallo-hydrolase [Galbitalea sp.]|jgi:glyoxylase-like metal-dependent hydrolase (beta-lactamase superfamily II)/rhodanese-related sulfurtransferase|nr:MBL fold metallo-hydrolase [Galbitalea sp.]